jgi:hypothetical protein
MNFTVLKERLSKYSCKWSVLKYFLRSPSLVFAIPSNPLNLYFSKTLEKIFDSNIVSCLYNFLPERFFDHLKKRGFGDLQRGQLLILYLIVKKYKPDIVVETGVKFGASSAFMLCAMHENSKGHLYSIDLPPYDASAEIVRDDSGMPSYILEDGQRINVNEEYEIGYLVPEYLKERWTLIIGDAKKQLPILLKKLNKISIFFHDSLHTYEQMMFEFENSWQYITKGGILISHDVLLNEAFLKFSKKKNLKPLFYYYSLAGIKKVDENNCLLS